MASSKSRDFGTRVACASRSNCSISSFFKEEVNRVRLTRRAEELSMAQGRYEELECRRYFLHGVRFGLELLRL